MEVALKITKNTKAAIAEYERLIKLDHPNVVQVLDLVRKDEYCENDNPDDPELQYTVPWIVLEYVPGGSLLDFILNYRQKGGCPVVSTCI